MRKILTILNNSLIQEPRWTDAIVLMIFTVLITLHPYYLNNEINMYELGLYLPGIQAIQDGMVPFRDFFHLRGPLDLYLPGWLMEVFGHHVQVISAYFFVGNVLCLIFVVLIAKELIRTRFILYMMIPVIIARTFPRVCFMNWGGMRYALGLMAIYCFIRFLKKPRMIWIAVAGFLTAAAGLISAEMGVFPILAVMLTLAIMLCKRLIDVNLVFRASIIFLGAVLIGAAPWVIYSIQHNAFFAYLDAFWTMVTRFQIVINLHLADVFPSNLSEAVASMINPASENFKQMTPAYTYIFLLGYLIVRWCKNRWGVIELSLLSLGIFGFVMYNTAFRAILASQFEMALMPEKIIYFFLIEVFVLWLWAKNNQLEVWKKNVISFCLIALFLSSIAYAFARYNNRFWSFKYIRNLVSGKSLDEIKFWDKNIQYKKLTLNRMDGIWVPINQEKELNALDQFITKHSQEGDVFVMYPEIGVYHYLFDRQFLGRFPFCTFAWLNDRWFEEYFDEFKELKAKFVIVQKKMPEYWEKIYLGYPPNKVKYDKIIGVLKESYSQVAETPMTWIYARKD